ncbi:hypothetical protein AWC38_SpisGene11809 [Stylophora pistillata]|uniref:Uncharacterized protein n=1 Tax=Stylophora pistillata TaxID=50429 RepID=A0A2B4S4D5_STYPI|nr:hypothetical protein AWC38_SpisGene11809 [Stylophora pistillata]
MCRMETPMKKPTKGVKGKRHNPYDKGGPLHFKKEWAEKHPDGKVMINGVPEVAKEPKKNLSKKKNIKNLSLPKIPIPPSRTAEEEEEWKENWRKSVDAYYAQDILRIPPPPPPPVEVNVLEEGEIPEADSETQDTPEVRDLITIRVQVYVPKQTEFINLARSFVELDLGFQTPGNGNLTSRVDDVNRMLTPVNNIAHSLFKQINAKLNGTLITEQVDMYHLKAFIQTLLNFDREEGETILAAAGWRNNIDSRETYTAASVKSEGAAHGALSATQQASILTQKADAQNYVGGKKRVLRVVPFEDIFHQGNWLAPRTEMDFKFYLNPVALYFNAEANPGAEEVRQHIDDIKLTFYICFRIVLGILATTAFNGQYDKDPFAFGQFGMEWVKQIWNGEEYPYETMQLNTGNGYRDMMGCHRFLEATGCLYKKGGNKVRTTDWGHEKNCTLFAWSNVANRRYDDPILLPKEAGFINIQLKCAAQTAQRTIVIYSEYESMLEIDGFKGGVSMDVN